MFKKYLLIIFIILFSNTYIYAETKENINYIDVYNKLMDKNYIIDDESLEELVSIYKSLNNNQLEQLCKKYTNDISKRAEKYATYNLESLNNKLMKAYKISEINSIYTISTLKKYFIPDIKKEYFIAIYKEGRNTYFKKHYPEALEDLKLYINFDSGISPDDPIYKTHLRYIDYLLIDIEDSYNGITVGYKYAGKNQIKVKGVFSLSNISNYEFIMDHSSDNHVINKFLPKTDFTSYDRSFELKNLSIRPKKFTYGSNIYPNILSQGKFGRVNFDAEITLSLDSAVCLDLDRDLALISVEEIKLNKVVSSLKYSDPNEFYKSGNIVFYELVSDDGYVNLRDAPNGKIIKKIKLKGNSGKYVYHHKGLFNFEDEENTMFTENFDEQFYNKFKGYYSKINKLLNMPESILGQWYRVVYIPSRDDLMLFLPDENYDFQIIGSAIYGYVHSSQLNGQ